VTESEPETQRGDRRRLVYVLQRLKDVREELARLQEERRELRTRLPKKEGEPEVEDVEPEA
jgi:hypothetical protein